MGDICEFWVLAEFKVWDGLGFSLGFQIFFGLGFLSGFGFKGEREYGTLSLN